MFLRKLFLYILILFLDEVPSSAAVDIVSYSKTEPPMRRTNSSPDINTIWIESGSADTDHFQGGSHLQDSAECDKESLMQGSGECDNSELSFSKENFFFL